VKIIKITAKNFLSFGNNTEELNIDLNELVLLQGRNGAGKSSISETITYALYGKTLRNVKKSDLVNKVNRKECIVTIEFEQHGFNYLVRRGISPNIFEIFKNGELVNQSSSVLDYQTILETEILKMSYNMFRQLVILSPSSFTSFFEMSASNRRGLLEELLGLTEISMMLNVLNGKIVDVKSKQNTTKATSDELTNTIKTLNDSLKKSRESSDELSSQIQSKIDKLKLNLDHARQAMDDKIQCLTELQVESVKASASTIDSTINQLQHGITEINAIISQLNKEVQFLESNDNCPTCHQDITQEHKTELINKNNTKKESVAPKLDTVRSKIESLSLEKSSLTEVIAKANELTSDIRNLSNVIKQVQTQIDDNTSIILEVSTRDDIQFISDKVNDTKNRLIETLTLLQDIGTQLNLYTSTKMFLSDDGIRKHIIQKYIPFIVNKVNEWLELLDFFAVLEINDDFDEVIKVRGFDPTKYGNLSSGERAKLTLALVMTFRELLSIRNNSTWNLLSLDEILETIDAESKNKLFWSLRNISEKEQMSIMVVSHGTSVTDQFHKVMEVNKIGNFTKITNMEL
jgi:DNA repair exonuclease SbcCD ATPase subunit